MAAAVPEFERSRQCLVLYAFCDERAVRLMKDHFVDDRAFPRPPPAGAPQGDAIRSHCVEERVHLRRQK